jgi:nucleotide-binding universal stress UspA family protein
MDVPVIKSILLPATGEVFDEAVLDTALRVAQLGPAHIELSYLCRRPGEVAETARQVGWAIGGAAMPAVALLDRQIEQQATKARAVFVETCRRKGVVLVDGLQRSTSITASWHVLHDDFIGLADHARHVDLIVMGRPGRSNGLTRSHLETVLSAGGRPLLIAPSARRSSIAGTAFVCWKESPEAARALSAALPLLARAQRIVVASVAEDPDQTEEPLQAVARYLAFHGLTAELRLMPRSAPVPDVLGAAADGLEADLIVLGAYGHSRAREVVLGGCTRSFLDRASVPVLMMR